MKNFAKRLVISSPALLLWYAVVFGDAELQKIATAVALTGLIIINGLDVKV